MTRAAWLLVLAACGKGGPAPKPAGGQLGPALGAALEAADRAKAPWRCAATDGPTLSEETLAVGGQTWKLAGYGLVRDGKGAVTIGVIADAGGASPATLAALGRLRGKLGEAVVVVALGGMGTTQAELEATLGALADRASFPVVALPGDLESAPALAAATQAMRKRGQVVIDGRLAHTIDAGGATIEVVAGTLAATRLAAGDDGCLVAEQDAQAAVAMASERTGVRILASAEAPRATSEGEATGDLAITAPSGAIEVALHGGTGQVASPARSGKRGNDAAALTPGSADATPRLSGPPKPTAGLLIVNGDAWSWKPVTDSE
ncbi:MAG: hypothetical protein SFX73_33430 [Kofleriaceae bacterium]|nr:hypothetical protein [Kofleriaceae bacterium]